MIFRFSIPLLLLALSGCGPQAQPSDPLWTLTRQGSVHVRDDNSLVLYDNGTFTYIDAAGKVTGSTGSPAGQGSGQHIYQGHGMTDLLAGPDGLHLSKPSGPPGGGFSLASELDSELRLTLRPPAVEYASMSFAIGQSSLGEMCFLGSMPLVLHWHQLAMAYTDEGELLWEFMAGPGAMLTASPIGDRVCINDYEGRTYCLDAEGELLWEHAGLYYMKRIGNRLLGLQLDQRALHCLDWDGRQVWQYGLDVDSVMYRTFITDQFLPLCFVTDGQRIICLDEDGNMIWNRSIQSGMQTHGMLAADGYLFYRLRRSSRKRTWLGGRFGNRYSSQMNWVCLDPEGREAWRSQEMRNSGSLNFPGHAGVLFIEDRSNRSLSCYGPPDA